MQAHPADRTRSPYAVWLPAPSAFLTTANHHHQPLPMPFPRPFTPSSAYLPISHPSLHSFCSLSAYPLFPGSLNYPSPAFLPFLPFSHKVGIGLLFFPSSHPSHFLLRYRIYFIFPLSPIITTLPLCPPLSLPLPPLPLPPITSILFSFLVLTFPRLPPHLPHGIPGCHLASTPHT